jgi:hypothetical protein
MSVDLFGMRIKRKKAKNGEPARWFNEHIKDETDECIMWPFAKSNQGYGYLGNARVSVLVCEVRHGIRPGPEYEALHGPCHNPGCVNYRHLYWGTKRQNQLDRNRDGTTPNNSGVRNPIAKLNDEEIIAIRTMYHKNGISERDLAQQFCMSSATISRIVNGLTWQHLLPEPKGPDLFA